MKLNAIMSKARPQPGDIILVHSGSSLIARGITWQMRRKIRREQLRCKPYHHGASAIDVWNQLYIGEANAPGYQVQPASVAYSRKAWATRIDVFTPVVPYTDEEKWLYSRAAVEYALKVTRYDKFNFVWHLVYAYFGIWIGRNNDKLYCSEACAEIANRVRPGTFANPQRTTPVDIAVNRNYRII